MFDSLIYVNVYNRNAMKLFKLLYSSFAYQYKNCLTQPFVVIISSSRFSGCCELDDPGISNSQHHKKYYAKYSFNVNKHMNSIFAFVETSSIDFAYYYDLGSSRKSIMIDSNGNGTIDESEYRFVNWRIEFD